MPFLVVPTHTSLPAATSAVTGVVPRYLSQVPFLLSLARPVGPPTHTAVSAVIAIALAGSPTGGAGTGFHTPLTWWVTPPAVATQISLPASMASAATRLPGRPSDEVISCEVPLVRSHLSRPRTVPTQRVAPL